MEALYKAYKGKVQFLLVYIREAHPSRGSSAGGRSRFGRVAITQHKTLQERVIAADKCMKGLKLTIPIVLDTMEGTFLKTYGGFPAGTAVVARDGKIAYWNRGAPWGCRPKEAEAAIRKLLADGGGAIPEKWAEVKIPPDRPKAAPKAGSPKQTKPPGPTVGKAAPSSPAPKDAPKPQGR